jgi:hypothetical protein
LVSASSLLIGFGAAVAVFGLLVAAGPTYGHGFFGPSDAPSFLAVARDPFGTGHGFPGDPLAQGVAYRFGRLLLPLFAWALALGNRRAIPWSLAVAFTISVAAWVTVTGEFVTRAGRKRMRVWMVIVCPFSALWIGAPMIVAEPLAAALVLLVYLLHSDGRDGEVKLFAAAALLARETTVIAFAPLIWRAWKNEGIRGVERWLLVGVPYAAWSVWVLFRVGNFPLLDPASNRRAAFAPPFVGWLETLQRPFDHGQPVGLAIGAVTIAAAIVVLVRTPPSRRLLAWAAVASAALIPCFGWSVWEYPTEALRVMLPTHALLIVALCECRPWRRHPVASRREWARGTQSTTTEPASTEAPHESPARLPAVGDRTL